jgi:hypothetical protein
MLKSHICQKPLPFWSQSSLNTLGRDLGGYKNRSERGAERKGSIIRRYAGLAETSSFPSTLLFKTHFQSNSCSYSMRAICHTYQCPRFTTIMILLEE